MCPASVAFLLPLNVDSMSSADSLLVAGQPQPASALLGSWAHVRHGLMHAAAVDGWSQTMHVLSIRRLLLEAEVQQVCFLGMAISTHCFDLAEPLMHACKLVIVDHALMRKAVTMGLELISTAFSHIDTCCRCVRGLSVLQEYQKYMYQLKNPRPCSSPQPPAQSSLLPPPPSPPHLFPPHVCYTDAMRLKS